MSIAPAKAPQQLTIKQHPRTGAFRTILESDGFQKSLAAALPRHISPGRMLRVVLAAFQSNSDILNCTPESVLLSILQAAACGLEPDGGPLGQAYLVPFKGKCQFIPGYRGLVKLARNSGEVADVWAEVVYEKDTFEYELGLNQKLIHKRDDKSDDPGPLVFVYAVARFRDGEKRFVVLNRRQVRAIKNASPSAGSDYSPWKKWEAAMWQKTAVRQLAKLLPLSVEVATQVGAEDTPLDAPKLDGIDLALDMPAIEDHSGEGNSENLDAIAELKGQAIDLGCPSDAIDGYIEIAQNEANPAEYIASKPWEKAKGKQTQKTIG